MYLGRYRKGDWLPVSVQCTNNLAILTPDAAPVLRFYTPSFSFMFSRTMPLRAPGRRNGLFEIEQFLGSDFAEGVHHGHVSYSSGGNNFADLFRFEVVPSGHQSGSYINLHFYEKPHASFVVGQLDVDLLEFRKNPEAQDG